MFMIWPMKNRNVLEIDMDKTTYIPTKTTLPIPPERVLEGAIKDGLQEVFVVGICKDGTLYTASSTSEIGDMLLLMERAKRSIMTHVNDGD